MERNFRPERISLLWGLANLNKICKSNAVRFRHPGEYKSLKGSENSLNSKQFPITENYG